MTQLAALNVKITGDSADLQSDLSKTETALTKLGRVMDAAEAKARNFDRALTKSTRSLSSLQTKINSATGVTNKLSKSAQMSAASFAEFDRMSNSIDSLRASYDPAFASAQKYEAAVRQLDAALDAGVISQKRYNTILKQAKLAHAVPTAGAKKFSGSLGLLNGVSGQTRAQIQNTSFQLQDIAVQLEMGTAASRVFAQQLPQLAGGFGPVGAAVGVLAGVGIPALAFALQGLGNESEDTEDALDNFVASLNSARDLMRNASKPIEDLREEFGEFADEIQRASEVAARATLSQALDQYSDAAAGVKANFETLSSELINYQAAVEAAAIVTNVLGERTTLNASAFDDVSASVTAARSKVEEVAAEMGMGVTEATRLNAALQKISDAQGMDEIAASSAEAVDLIGRMFTESEKMPPEIAAIVIELEKVASAAASGATAFDNMGDAAETSTDKMTTAAEAAREFVAARRFASRFAGEELLMSQSVVPVGQGEPPSEPTSTQANPLVAQLDSLQQSLMTQEEAQIASFERQQETLTSALEQQLLTRQEYNELMEDAEAQHSQRMAGLAVYKYGDTLAQTGQFLGDMASAMQGGNDKMLRIAKVFGAAEALINSYRAYNQVISNPGLPWYAKIPAAVSVLGAGLGMVNAIKGVSPGGGSAGAASNATAGGGAAATPQTSNNVAIQLTGGDMFSRDQVIQLINGINDAVDDGAQIRLV